MILLSNKATQTPFFRKIKGGVKGFECQVFIKNGLINAKLTLKQKLVFKNLFQFRCKAPLNP
ncbi:hypothetical protein ckin5_07690 [Helicobacter pylori]|uniref:hypothetical protein n=1 Tax=Helicobacter pylori TaxID=210 RepID=UPI000D3ABBAA|nr:hypothetical protein [Helicobacter pylori]PUD40900.1 hypothetical protein C2R75_04170 [Helicobacter pylori]